MRSVRCDVCGTKALTAASQCPKCSHLFEVRDGFGDLHPLAYCSMCDSYYPERVGSCRWCGTKPEPLPNAAEIWKRVGAGALVALVAVGWFLRDTGPRHAADAPVTMQGKTVPSSKSDTQSEAVSALAADTALAAQVATADSAVPALVRALSALPTPTPSSDSAAPTVTPPPLPAAASSVRASQPATKIVATAPTKAKPAARWVNSMSKDWVVVRAGPSKSARLVAGIGPNIRVQLGETRGTWRRIRARNIVGWVEPRSFFVGVVSSTRSVVGARE
jgi:hypothetical protein